MQGIHRRAVDKGYLYNGVGKICVPPPKKALVFILSVGRVCI